MNASYLLLKSIKEQLESDFKGFVLRAPAGDGRPTDGAGDELYREPTIFIGGFPEKRASKPIPLRRSNRSEKPEPEGNESFVPFIMVRLLDYGGPVDDLGHVIANVGIIFVVYVAEYGREAGMHDLLNVGDRISSAMCADRSWGDNRWLMVPPVQMIQGTGRAENIYDSGLQSDDPFFGGAVAIQFQSLFTGKDPNELIGSRFPG